MVGEVLKPHVRCWLDCPATKCPSMHWLRAPSASKQHHMPRTHTHASPAPPSLYSCRTRMWCACLKSSPARPPLAWCLSAWAGRWMR